MKKTLLASAILASLVSVSAQAATVYDQDGTVVEVLGGAEVVAVSKDSVEGTFGNDNYGYVGLTGTSVVSDSVTAYATFVLETSSTTIDKDESDTTDTEETFFTSGVDDLIVGFDTTYGDFSFGGTDSAIGQVADFTDIGAYHGGIQEDVEGEGAVGFGYANSFGGVTVNAEYIASESKDSDSIGLSAVYSADFGLDLGLGYVVVDEANELALAVGYSVADLYVGVGYAIGEKSETEEFTSLEVAAQYNITDALTVTALMGLADKEVSGTTTDTKDYFAIDASYAVNGSVTTYVSFKSDNIDGVTDDAEFVAGVAYDF